MCKRTARQWWSHSHFKVAVPYFANINLNYHLLLLTVGWPSPCCLFQAFNKCKREGFRLQTVDKAPLAKRRKMKKTSTSTDTRSSSSESTHSSSSSSQSQEKTATEGDANLQPSNNTPLTTPGNTPLAVTSDIENQPAPPAFSFTEGQWVKKSGQGEVEVRI